MAKKKPNSHFILEHLREPHTAAEIIPLSGSTRATVYRRLKELLSTGMISQTGETYRASDAGLRLLDGGGVSPARPLEKIWPWLNLLPTDLHKGAATLAFFALIARRSNSVEDCHPGLILLGPTQRWKSWLIKILCHLAGTTAESCRVQMQQVRQRGLLVRLDAKGAVTYVLEQLKQPFLWLEELSLAEPGVRRDVTALMQGTKEIRIENQTLCVDAVPLIESNPVKREGSLSERLGLKPERARRNLIADFTSVEISRAIRPEVGARLEQIRSLNPLALPPATLKTLSAGTQEMIHEVIEQLVRPEMIDFVDASRIMALVLGASAVLVDEVDAAVEVLWCWSALAESTGFLVPEWRTRLAGILSPAPSQSQSLSQSQPKSHAEIEPNTTVLNQAYSEGGADMNRYKLDEVLLEHKNIMDESGLQVPEDSARIRGLAGVLAAFKKKGVPIDPFVENSDAWAELANFNARLTTLEAQGFDFKGVWELTERLGQVGMTPAELDGFIGIRELAAQYHLEPLNLFELERTLISEIGHDDNKFTAIIQLVDAAVHGLTMRNRLVDLQIEIRRESRQLKELRGAAR